MKIVQPYARIDYLTQEPLRLIESYARVSHRSEAMQNDLGTENFIRRVVIEHGDWSVTEHVSAVVEALVDRGITHEWVRHRLGSYTQESTRFVNYEKKMEPSFIYPQPDVKVDAEHDGEWLFAIHQAESAYKALIRKGWRPQEARSVFPNALASKLISTYNLRSWRHFFLMRTTKEAHPQMRQVTIPLLEEFKRRVPLLYDDIEPNARQIDNMRKPR